MGLFRYSYLFAVLILILAVVIGWKQFFEVNQLKTFSIETKYFGQNLPSSTDQEDTTIKSFQIRFDPSQVEDCLDRLRHTRFSSPQILVDHHRVNQSTYGFPLQAAEIIRQYWSDKYDWRETVQELNQFQHYQTLIDGLNIHFVRVHGHLSEGNNKQAILFLHGWPSSFLEYLDVARLLNSSSHGSYDLIIPSLPGFGYSDAPVRPGLSLPQIGRIMNTLMGRLGHQSYVVCGGDWGSFIGIAMVHLYPSRIRGFLTTMVAPEMSLKNSIRVALAHWISPSFLLDRDEEEFLVERFDALKLFKFFWYEGGYLHIQATKPDTIGYALNDSPLGLAVYLLEKWSRWSNGPTDIDRSINAGLDRFTLDQLLSTVMLYWTTGTITSSMRIYFEDMSAALFDKNLPSFNGPISSSVPVAIVNYRHEIAYTPRRIAKEKYPNIKLWTYHREGGHFAAIEKAKDYANDLEQFLLGL